MIAQTTLTLDAIAPAYLEARADAAEARRKLRGLQLVSKSMASQNTDHAAEVAAADRTGNALITNGQAARRGSGSGCEVIYRACSHSGFPPDECECDPRTPPFSDADIRDAEKAINDAEEALKAAETTLDATPSSFDAFAAAREAGATHVWWPMDRNVDPRLRRYQGQPVTVEEVQALGAHAMNRGVQAGGIIEVPS